MLDAHYDSVSLLLPLNGPNGGKSFLDYSPAERIITPTGNVSTITSIQRHYGSSALFTAGGYLSLAYATAFDWWKRPTTVETHVYLTSTSQTYFIGGMSPTSNTNYWAFGLDGTLKPVFYYWTGAARSLTGGLALSINAWHHLRMTFDGSTLRLFLDGVVVAESPLLGTPVEVSGVPLTIGRVNNLNYLGCMQDLRVTSRVLI